MYNYYSGSIVSARLSEPLDMMEDDVTVLADSDLKIAAEAVPYLNYFLYVRMFLDILRSYARSIPERLHITSDFVFSET